MSSFNRYSSQNYAPSAPSVPESYRQEPPQPGQQQSFSSSSSSTSPYNPNGHNHAHPRYGQSSSYNPHGHPSYGQSDPYNPGGGQNYGQPSYGQFSSSSPYGYPSVGVKFPPGTNPEIIRSFEMVDKDRSGFIDEKELQEALSFGYQKFSIRTVRLLMFLFKNPNDQLKIGPNEFAALWDCLGQWRGIFERFDRDRSGKIDSTELRDALHSLGYLVPPSVLQVLISKYDDGSGRRGELNFDSFVECGMIVKGLTEKFKEKDTRYVGSATLNYDTFMAMVIPFIVP